MEKVQAWGKDVCEMINRRAAALMAAVVLLGAVLGGCDSEFQNPAQEATQLQESTHCFSIAETFRALEVESVVSDVRLLPSVDGSCSVVCSETSGLSHSAAVEVDTLVIREEGERSISEETTEILVFLPQPEYDSLNVTTETGSVDVTMDFAFSDVSIRTVTGEAAYRGAADGSMSLESESGRVLITGVSPKELSVKTESGSIIAQSVLVQEDLNIQTVTGDLTLANVTCKNATAAFTTGQVILEQVLAEGELQLTGESGDVTLTGCDATALEIQTTTGSVTGTLLTDKSFLTTTETGEVNVPDTTGGTCHVTTESGNIDIKTGGNP